MKAIVLAAGRGERMRPLTDSTPKPLLAVKGEPLIGHHLRALARAGVREVVINLSWLGGQIRSALGTGAAFGVRIRYSEEGAVALETGGGIFHALPLLAPGPFLVVNGDVWSDFDLASLTLESDAHARLVLVPNPPQHARGDFALHGDRITAGPGERFTYSGIGIFRPELFTGCIDGRFPLLPLLERALRAGKLRGQIHRGEWSDIGTPERLAALNARLGSGDA
ncbi:MAG TPA: nucleotidyltransferase family protein [Steroidobacteraceae bacterium]|nr:nucleotidyltransferase family protein [Steroidobacteraceae bacterium]